MPPTPDRIPTPYLQIDAAVMRKNVKRLAAYAAAHSLRVRPHTKTHKSRQLARLQLEAGAAGLTVAKVGEADVMASLTDDLLLAYSALDPERCTRAAELAREKTLRIAIDSKLAAENLNAAAQSVGGAGSRIGILVDLDVGLGRTGVQSPQAALELAQHVARARHLRLDGIMCYPGHVGVPRDQQLEPLGKIAARLAETIELWRRSGLQAAIVSGGSTPTAYQSHHMPQLTEIRPGTYIFNDMNCVRGAFCELSDCAARIVCTVISNAVPGQVVLDGGSKTFTSDHCGPAPDSGHGHIVEYPGAKITKLTEEHGQTDITRCSRAPALGERVTVIPNHICPCVNLQDRVWLRHENGELEPLPVDARGKLS